MSANTEWLAYLLSCRSVVVGSVRGREDASPAMGGGLLCCVGLLPDDSCLYELAAAVLIRRAVLALRFFPVYSWLNAGCGW